MTLKHTYIVLLALMTAMGISNAQEISNFQRFREIRQLQSDAQMCIIRDEHKDAAKLYRKIAGMETSKAKQAAAWVQAADQFLLAEEGNDALEIYRDILQNYSLYAPHDHVVAQLRKLAEDFIIGKSTFLSLTDVSGAIKIYELIIRESPAAHVSEQDRFRLAQLLRQEDRPEEAVALYQAMIKKSIRNWNARAELALVLAQLAAISDGDGTKTRAALREAKLVLAYKPDHEKADELKKLIEDAYQLSANRLLQQAEFYLVPAHKRIPAARRYLHDVILKYPNSKAAQKAKQHLASNPALQQLEKQPSQTKAQKPAQTTTPPTKTKQPQSTHNTATTVKPAFEKPSVIRKSGKPAFDKPSAVNRSGKPAFQQPSPVRRDGKPAFPTPTKINRSGKPAFEKPSEFFRQQHGLNRDKPHKPAFDQPSEYFKLVHGKAQPKAKRKPAFEKPSQFFLDQQKKAQLKHNEETGQKQSPAQTPKPAVKAQPNQAAQTQVHEKNGQATKTAKAQPNNRPNAPALPPKPTRPTTPSQPALPQKPRPRKTEEPVFQPSALNHPVRSSGFTPSPLNKPVRKSTLN